MAYIETAAPNLSKSAEFTGIKQNVLKWAAKYAVAEGIMAVLKSMGKKVVIKNVAKFLPFIGNIISAGIGYKMTTAFGEQYLDEAEEHAERILQKVVSD